MENVELNHAGIIALLMVFGLLFFTGCPPENYSKIVFMHRESAAIWGDLYIMKYDGSDWIRLTDSGSDAYPKWSPEKDQIVFNRRVGGASGHWDIYKINADGTGLELLVGGPADDVYPAWSPDGAKLAYQSNRDGRIEMWIYDVGHRSEVRLDIDPAITPSFPTWSPNGDWIAFRGVGSPAVGGHIGIWIVSYPGGGGTSFIAENGNHPDWYKKSRIDGGKIVYDEGGDIKVMKADGSDKRTVIPGEFPTWSVNFDEIIFHRYYSSPPDTDTEIYKVREDGTYLIQLTDDLNIDERYPHW